MNSKLERSCYFVVVIAGLLIGLLSCSKNPTDPNDQDYPQYNNLLEGVTFEPSSGAPGTIITMIGLDSLPVDSGFSLTLGDQPAPLIVASGQPIRTAIPLYMDTTISSWPITPTGLQTVTLLYNDIPVDSVLSVIRVDSLTPAPGAMAGVMTKLSAGAAALKEIALALDAGDTLLLATCDAMDELLFTGDYSLTALFKGTSPVVGYDSSSLEIFSSLMVSSGVSDAVSRWSDTLVAVSKIARQLASSQSTTNFLSDEQLASRMQLHDFLEGFGSQVVGQTALDWQVASGIIGAVGIAIPVVGQVAGIYEFIISWVLGELDFIINKIAIAMLPSDVTRLDLDFYNHQIAVGDTTEAIVRISAKNNPPNITPADIIGQVLAGLRLTQWIQNQLGPAAARTLRSIIQNIVNWALGVITNVLTANYNSPTSLDVALPAATWDSVWIHNPGLIDMIIPDQSKIGYINGSFNGQAKDSPGTIGLQMRTQPPGPSTYINPTLSILGYAGGAFGDDLTTSNIDTVTIVGELALKVDFANTITVGGANVLGVNAGYYDRDGNPHWEPNIDISLMVADGSADVTSGVTDAQGNFSSIITVDSTADSVTVNIFAYGEYNSQADTTVVAVVVSNSSSINGIAFRGHFEAVAQADTVYRFKEWFQQDYLESSDGPEKNMNTSFSPSSSFPGGTADAFISYDCNLKSDSADGVITMTETFSMSSSVAYTVGSEGYYRGRVVTSYFLINGKFLFDVKGNAVVTIEYNSGPASGFDLNDVLLENTEIIISNGTWQGVLGEGTHTIGFRQVHSLTKTIPSSQSSYNNQSNSGGTMTLTIEPQ